MPIKRTTRTVSSGQGDRTLSRWTARKRQLFLQELEKSANVVLSAQVAGLSPRSAYHLRQRDAAFAEQWRQSLEMALDQIEAAVFERVRGQPAGKAGKRVADGFSERLAMFLLNRHRPGGFAATRVAASSPAPETDAIEEIERRLSQLDGRRDDS